MPKRATGVHRITAEFWRSWRRDMAAGEMVFFVGAGVSADPPSLVPLADGVTVALIEEVARAGGFPPSFARECIEACQSTRPEVLCDILMADVGGAALSPLTKMLQGAPNAWHHMLAYALECGCAVITTNFDVLIEDACARRRVGYERIVARGRQQHASAVGAQGSGGLLIKVHGSLPMAGEPESVARLALALRHVTRGLRRALADQLRILLSDRPLMVLGYAGRDDFDLRPFLLSLERRQKALWVVHDRTEPGLRPVPPPGPLDVFSDEFMSEPAEDYRTAWGRRTVILRGDTSEVQRLMYPAAARDVGESTADQRTTHATHVGVEPAPTSWRRAMAYALLEVRHTTLAIRVCQFARRQVKGDSYEATRLTTDEAAIRDSEGASFDHAIRVCNRAVRMARRVGDPTLLAGALDTRGVLARRKGRYRAALRYYTQALDVLPRGRTTKSTEIRIRAHRAVALEYLRRYTEALEEYRCVRTYERRSGDLCGLVKTLNNIGIVYGSLGRLARAERYFRESIRIKRLLGDARGMGASYHGIGKFQYDLGDPRKAGAAFEEAYRLRLGPGRDPHGAAQSLVGMGYVALRSGYVSTAALYALRSLDIMRGVGDDTGIKFAQELWDECGAAATGGPQGQGESDTQRGG